MLRNINDYLVFYEVAACENMRRAAERLELTPPTISRVVQELEERLGCRLFVRSKRGARLTAAGEALYARIKPAISLLQSGEEEARMFAALETGRVAVGAGDMTARYFLLPGPIREFCHRYPKVQVQLHHLSKGEAEAMLCAGEIDLAVMSATADWDGEQVEEAPLFEERDIAVAGETCAFLAEEERTLEELAEHPLVFVPEAFSVYGYYDRLFSSRGLSLSPRLETAVTEEQLMAVENGMGYTFVPAITAAERLKKGLLHEIKLRDAPLMARKISLFTPRKFPLSKAAAAMAEMIRSCARAEI